MHKELIERLRDTAQSIRRKPTPLSHVIPQLTQSADALEVLVKQVEELKENSSPIVTCGMCQGTGCSGHLPDDGMSDKCELCDGFGALRIPTKSAPSAPQIDTNNIPAMARILSDRNADSCEVDREDNWKLYGQSFIADVEAMLQVKPTKENKQKYVCDLGDGSELDVCVYGDYEDCIYATKLKNEGKKWPENCKYWKQVKP